MKKQRFCCAGGVVLLVLTFALFTLATAVFAGGAIGDKPLIVNPNQPLPGRSFTLAVEVGKGVQGKPVSGTMTFGPGTMVAYSYTPMINGVPIIVRLDGAEVASSGTFIMNRNHKLETRLVRMYKLKVMETYYQDDIPCYAGTVPCRHEGIPVCGQSVLAERTVVPYDLWHNWGPTAKAYLAAYPPGAGCPPILVNLGDMAPGQHLTGSFVMDRDYTLVIRINIE